MEKTTFFVSGTYADCLAFFKMEYVFLSCNHIFDLLTKSAVYQLYISETYEEAKALGECIYQFEVPLEMVEDNKGLFPDAEQADKLEIPVLRIK